MRNLACCCSLRLFFYCPLSTGLSLCLSLSLLVMAQFVGKVIGTQMMKTAKVEVTRMVLHPHVLKYVKRRKKYLCHDPESSCRVGDLVMIRSCQPLSKRKHFTVAEILDLSLAHRAELEQRRLRELDSTPGGTNATEGS